MEFPYYYTSIVTGKQIPYGPMKVRHQKKLVEMSEQINDGEEQPMSFVRMLEEMCIGLIDCAPSHLYYSDFEYLVFLIRAKSYGDTIQYTKHVTDPETIKDFTVNSEFSICKDIEVIGEKGLNSVTVESDSGDGIVMSPLKFYEQRESIELCAGRPRSLAMDMAFRSMRKIIKGGEMCEFSSEQEKQAYFEDLTTDDLKKMKAAMSRFPIVRVSKTVVVKAPSGKEVPVTTKFSDMTSSFFVL